jgi:DNA polymerase III delta prime subunit
MYFDSIDNISKIAKKVGCSVFVVPANTLVEIKNALVLEPVEKSVITIEQVRNILARLNVRQTSDVFVVIRPAETLGLEAANAMLKNLEEPGEKVHFVLITDKPSLLLPTILSRSAVYFLREKIDFSSPVNAEKKVLDLARRLVVAKNKDLPALAEEITKKKEGVRAYALSVLTAAIEILYKSYLKTEKDIFLNKIPRFLSAYEAITQNGHIKLHLVADLMTV